MKPLEQLEHDGHSYVFVAGGGNERFNYNLLVRTKPAWEDVPENPVERGLVHYDEGIEIGHKEAMRLAGLGLSGKHVVKGPKQFIWPVLIDLTA